MFYIICFFKVTSNSSRLILNLNLKQNYVQLRKLITERLFKIHKNDKKIKTKVKKKIQKTVLLQLCYCVCKVTDIEINL